ncbi:MAG: sodium-translocating pyrophosphatase [Armatimonadetes bacterium]|nr:sodium-translocating pyrophosphatase [Armatimonadota bacterium]
MSESSIVLPQLGSMETMLLYIVLISAFIGLGYGWYLVQKVLREDPGSAEMVSVAGAIQEGAMAYLSRQVKTMIWFVLILTVGLFFMYNGIYSRQAAEAAQMGNPVNFNPTSLAIGVAIAFMLGVFASYGAGYVGMGLAVRANVRTAASALKSYKQSLEVAFQAGTVSGMFTVGLGLIGATVIFLIYKEYAMRVLVGFGFGGCLAALFMRIGGGIFTKAADVGADLVGKVEKNIPEDDPRNAATIADNVGDNVGDCAGMAADVFESYEVTLVAAIILGAATQLDSAFTSTYGANAGDMTLKLIIYPLLVRAVGVFASIIGTFMVRGSDDENMDPMKPINFGFNLAAAVAVVGFGLVNYFYLTDSDGNPDFRFFAATLLGIVLALIIGKLTEYFTAIDKRPVTEIAYASRTGPATMILEGFASGLESSVWAVLAIAATIFGSMIIFQDVPSLAAYGIALSGLGLLTTTGYILAMDTFGPISDNANGIIEMSGALQEGDDKATRIVARLDAAGNTTKALTKGFAIATAVIAAISLFRSFIDEAKLFETGIQVNIPEVFIGLLIGAAVPFLFSSFAIRAVSRAAFQLVEEVRRQFREIPGIMEGKNKPDYSRCVAISTQAAQKELLGPALLGIFTPILVVFALGYSDPSKGAAALGGFLCGAIASGQLMAVLLANSGGAWDNGKKKIEDGLFGGKGTDNHKAAVVCDTVGDPFKDTAGPALNPLIKVMNLVAILVAPVAIQPDLSQGARWTIILISLAALVIAVVFNKRGSIVEMEGEKVAEKVKA